MGRWSKRLRVALLFLLCPSFIHADIIVGVASNFLRPAQEISDTFSDRTGIDVKIVSGSSGKIASMILRGAPIDVFLSADQDRPVKLEEAELVLQRAPYALGRIAVYAPDSEHGDDPLERLSSGKFLRLAIAEPRLAPYGRAAEQTLESLGIRNDIGKRLVVGENIGQTFGFVATGNADIGIVALSQLVDFKVEVSEMAHLLDSNLHEPIVQEAVLLRSAKDKAAARMFFDNLFALSTQETIVAFGYEVPSR